MSYSSHTDLRICPFNRFKRCIGAKCEAFIIVDERSVNGIYGKPKPSQNELYISMSRKQRKSGAVPEEDDDEIKESKYLHYCALCNR